MERTWAGTWSLREPWLVARALKLRDLPENRRFQEYLCTVDLFVLFVQDRHGRFLGLVLQQGGPQFNLLQAMRCATPISVASVEALAERQQHFASLPQAFKSTVLTHATANSVCTIVDFDDRRGGLVLR